MALLYRPLGRTGVLVSRLCFGTMNFADGTDDEEADRIIGRFLEMGGNFVDTANVYADGQSEAMLGRVLKRLRKRDALLIATKVRGKLDEGPNSYGTSQLHIVRAVEKSLERLQLDHIDLLQIHHPDAAIPIDETLAALDRLIQSGKVLYVGCSNFPAWTIVNALWTSAERHLARFISEQPPYNLLDRRVERDLLPMAQTYGIAILPWGPLAGGMLSGKYHRASAPPAGSRYTNDRYRGVPISEALWQVLEDLELLADAKGIPLSQLALAWVMSRPAVTAPIVGARTLQQLEDNLSASQHTLTPDDEAAIDAIVPPGSFVKNYYTMRDDVLAR